MIFQEFDCPAQGGDQDLTDDAIVVFGQAIQCSWCGGSHIAGVDVQLQTAIGDGEQFEFRPLPRDAKERAEWILEAARLDQPRAN